MKERKDLTDDMILEGCEIWCCLMERLKPDAIICSIAEQHLQRLNITDEEVIKCIKNKKDTTKRKEPYTLKKYKINFDTRHSCHLFYGHAANTPFGSLSDKEKTKIGESILSILNGKKRGTGDGARKGLQ